MGIVGFLARSNGRGRLGSWVLLTALLALASAVALAAWAGSRRTGSAYPRLLEATAGYDVTVGAAGDLGAFRAEDVAGLDAVERLAAVAGYGAMPLLADGTPDFERGYYFTAAADRVAYRAMGAPIVLEGRLPDPDRPEEVVVNATTVEQDGVGIGGRLQLCIFDFTTIESFGQPEVVTPEVLRRFVDEVCAVHRFTVVGVARFLDEALLSEVNEGQAFVVATPAFADAAGVAPSYEIAAVDLEGDAVVADFEDDVRAVVDPAAAVQLQTPGLREVVAARTATPYTRTLLLFAGAVAVAVIGVLGPALRRALAWSAPDRLVLLASGVRGGQLRAAAVVGGVVVGAAAAALAAVAATLVSDRFPIGPLRQAEPSPGTSVDLVVLVGGGLAVIAVAALAGASIPVGSPRRPQPPRPSSTAEWLAARGGSPAVVTGLRAATARTAGRPGPLAAAGGFALAVVAVLAAFGFRAGLVRLLDEPPRYGFTWDVTYEAYETTVRDEVTDHLDRSDLVTGVALGFRTGATVDGAAVNAYGFEDRRGTVGPVVLEGRAPVQAGEVALGGQTMDRIGAVLGSPASLRIADREVSVTVVGRTLLPLLSLGDDVSIGEGAWVPAALLQDLGIDEPGLALIDLVPGATATDLRRELVGAGVEEPQSQSVLGPAYSTDLRAYDEIRWTPVLLGGVLGVLGVGVLAHALLGAVAARKRELAVLRSLGLDRRQVASSVRWQAVGVVGWCLAVAVPVGVAAGRTTWSAFARGLGVADDPATPAATIALVSGGLLVGSVLLAALLGRRAAAVLPATVLRGE